MPIGRDFSKEKWNEIYATRARLDAYIQKVQPYTYYPEKEEPQQPVEQVIVHRHINYTSSLSKEDKNLLQQTALKATYLLKKINEKQTTSKYSIRD